MMAGHLRAHTILAEDLTSILGTPVWQLLLVIVTPATGNPTALATRAHALTYPYPPPSFSVSHTHN